MGYPQRKQEEPFTYGDYLNWSPEERWELIHGIAYDMSPAPTRKHQAIARNLLVEIANYLSDKNCEVYPAPFEVTLPKPDETQEEATNVVQPDLVVICDESKLTERGCTGAPDLIIEILSPSTAAKDMKEKLYLYETHGVKEYWIVDPNNRTVMIFKLTKSGTYGKPEIYVGNDIIDVECLEGLSINLDKIFE